MSKNNPFVIPTALSEASKTQAQRQQAATADTLFSSKALKEEIHRDDAEMVDDVAALRNRKAFTASGVGAAVDMGDEGVVLDVHDNMTTEQFILKKREVGLIRMSLEAKRKEIRKLEEEADRAEKKLHQQQSQLESTREKFNNFLKQSNLEQDVAVRKADEETRAKTEKTVEIKKLSAQIARVELDIKKSEAQIESCLAYKKFLGDLAKPKWFQDVLTSLRIEDETTNILLEAEERFLAQVDDLRKKNQALAAENDAEKEAKSAAGAKRGASYSRDSSAPPKSEREKPPTTAADLKSLEQQVEELHATMEAEVQARVTEMETRVEAEVAAMTPDQIRQAVNTQYDESRVPPYFKSVDELLEVFISVEEGNLFLIQNCQELEEELEEVAMQFMQEKQEMQTMTQQRQAQMDVLADKIRVAEEKLHQLVERDRALDAGKREPAASTKAGATTGGAPGAASSTTNKRKAEEAAAADMPPEVFKDQMENKIGYIFRTLTAGDTAIKNTMNAVAAAKAAQEGRDVTLEGGAAPTSAKAADTHVDAKKGLGPSTKNAAAKGATKGTTKTSTTAKGASTPAAGKAVGGGKVATAAASKATSSTNNDASHNIGSVEMLTLIENKLEEYHRYITDPANAVSEQLIQQIMKNSDKERRREARHEHMILQAAEQEERVRRALERSNAPVKKATGKPVLPRSHVVNEETEAKKKAREAAKNAKDDGDEFFR